MRAPSVARATSEAAADKIEPKAESIANRILHHFAREGPATAFEAQEALGIAGDTFRPRKRELEAQGWLEVLDGKEGRPYMTRPALGAEAFVLRITLRGKDRVAWLLRRG